MVQQDSANQVVFEEVQQFSQPWHWALMLAMCLVFVVCDTWCIFADRVMASQAVVPSLIFFTLWIGTGLMLFFGRMTVQVDHHHLHVRFLPFAKKAIPLGDISQWEVRTCYPILEYGGWGLRYGWKGWAYNVTGNRGVQLVLRNGKRILIGSQNPEQLAAAITEEKRQGGVG